MRTSVVLFALGWTVALIVSMEVVRTWIARSETFVSGAEAVRKVESASARAERAKKKAESAQDLAAAGKALNSYKYDLDDTQIQIQKKFIDLARKQVGVLEDAVASGSLKTEQRLTDLRGMIDAVEQAKISKSEFESVSAQIAEEIRLVEAVAANRDTAFMTAMDRALDAEDVQNMKVVKDIQEVYATKADNVELENTMNALKDMSRRTMETMDIHTEKAVAHLKALASVDEEMMKFEERNMRLDGEPIDMGFVDHILDLKRTVGDRIASLENSADALVRCEAQTNVRDRVTQLETDLRKSREECADAKSICDRALGQDPVVLKPDSHFVLGNTGKSLVMHGDSLRICDAPSADGTAANCRVIDASVSA